MKIKDLWILLVGWLIILLLFMIPYYYLTICKGIGIGNINLIINLIGVLVAFITLAIVLVIAFGFFEIRRWQEMREEVNKYLEEIKNKREEAHEVVEKINKIEIELENRLKDFKYNMNYLVGVFFNLIENKSDIALNILNALIAKEPTDIFLRDLRRRIYLKHGETEKIIDESLEIGVLTDPRACYESAKYFILTNEIDKAFKYLKRAIELDKKYKELARKDEDFKEYWNDEDFKRITS